MENLLLVREGRGCYWKVTLLDESLQTDRLAPHHTAEFNSEGYEDQAVDCEVCYNFNVLLIETPPQAAYTHCRRPL